MSLAKKIGSKVTKFQPKSKSAK